MDKEFEMFAEGLRNAWKNQTDDVGVRFELYVASLKRRALLIRRLQPT